MSLSGRTICARCHEPPDPSLVVRVDTDKEFVTKKVHGGFRNEIPR